MLRILVHTLLLISATTIAETVDTTERESLTIQIEKGHGSMPGHYRRISIFAHVGSDTVTSFDVTIAHQPDALKFIEVQSTAADFKYEKLNPAGIEDTANTGFIRIAGSPIPESRDSTGMTNLAQMKFLVSNSREFNCKSLPIRFAWIDCGDNTLVLKDGRQIIAARVFDWGWDGDLEDDNDDVTGNDCSIDYFAHFCGVCNLCADTDQEHAGLPGVFWNGVVGVVCFGYPKRHGDVNQNGIDNEIADARAFADGLLSGFDSSILPDSLLPKVTDINHDCAVASVSDLIYMVRIITGDAYPYPKLAQRRSELCITPKRIFPYPWHDWIRRISNAPSPPPIPAPVYDSVIVEIRDGSLEISCDTALAGIFAVFDFAQDALRDSFLCLQPMQLEYKITNDELRVLIWPGLENLTRQKNLTRQIPTGRQTLFTVPKGARLRFFQTSDYNGSLLDVIHITDSGSVRMPLMWDR